MTLAEIAASGGALLQIKTDALSIINRASLEMALLKQELGKIQREGLRPEDQALYDLIERSLG